MVKTPTLRNVNARGDLGHDRRYKNLEHLLRHHPLDIVSSDNGTTVSKDEVLTFEQWLMELQSDVVTQK